MLVSNLDALREEATPAISAHVDSINNCLVPECDAVAITGANLIQILDIGLRP